MPFTNTVWVSRSALTNSTFGTCTATPVRQSAPAAPASAALLQRPALTYTLSGMPAKRLSASRKSHSSVS